MFRYSTAGESHGRALIAFLEGVPAGVELKSEDIRSALARRRLGYGRGARQAFERDEVTILSGLRHGRTLGSPIAIEILNSEWPKWEKVMASDPVDRADLLIDAGKGDEREASRNKPLYRPRPGHADLVGMNKYGFSEARPVLERASARETAARVAAGAVAQKINEQVAGISVISRVVRLGQVVDTTHYDLHPRLAPQLDESPVRCLDKATEAAMLAQVDEAKKAGDTLGGIVEVLAFGVPQGLGSYVSASARLDARLAGAMMSIQAVKGVQIGDGFDVAATPGSHAHDEIQREGGRLKRLSNHAGGIEGGMSNGEVIRVSLAYKPISTVPRALRTIDTTTGEPATALHQRSDTTAVVPGAVIAEAMMHLVLAEALLEKTGGDSVLEARANLEHYLAAIPPLQR